VAGILGGLLAEKITKIKTSLYDVPKQ
jgi:hypothetical protein